MMAASSVVARSSVGIVLPYDCMNLIFDYLSQILDSKWVIVFDSEGRIHLQVNKYNTIYTNIGSLFRHKKQISGARALTLRVFNHYPDEMAMEVGAIEYPRPLRNKRDRETDLANGHMDFGWCYSYTNPLTGKEEYIYTQARCHIAANTGTFLGGTLYCDGGAYNVSDYNARDAEGIVNVGISPINLDWDVAMDIDEDIVEVVEGLIALHQNNFDPYAEDPDIDWEE